MLRYEDELARKRMQVHSGLSCVFPYNHVWNFKSIRLHFHEFIKRNTHKFAELLIAKCCSYLSFGPFFLSSSSRLLLKPQLSCPYVGSVSNVVFAFVNSLMNFIPPLNIYIYTYNIIIKNL